MTDGHGGSRRAEEHYSPARCHHPGHGQPLRTRLRLAG